MSQNDIYTLLANFFAVLLSAMVAFKVAKFQVKSNEKSLTKQIDAEIEKVNRQYELEQKRDNTNFITKLRLEKASELSAVLIKLNRAIPFYTSGRITKSEGRSDQQIYIDEYVMLEQTVDVLVNYFPAVQKKWVDINSAYIEKTNVIVEYYLTDDNLTDDQKKEMMSHSLAFQMEVTSIEREIASITAEIMNIIGGN